MAELGLIASMIQLAGMGMKLSIRMYSYAETVSSADKSMKAIAKDISLTSTVLQELGNHMEEDKNSMWPVVMPSAQPSK